MALRKGDNIARMAMLTPKSLHLQRKRAITNKFKMVSIKFKLINRLITAVTVSAFTLPMFIIASFFKKEAMEAWSMIIDVWML